MSEIIWTKTDEAPLLASYSLLPIVQAFCKTADIEVKTSDISVSNRILALFDKNVKDELSFLGSLVEKKDANIIKLPNISASVPQLKQAIEELQNKGYNVPSYPENPTNDEEKEVANMYKKVLGSAVNPVLRMGNSDRRAPLAVKNYAKKFPHSMGEWLPSSKAKVATMQGGDFYANEKSVVFDSDETLEIVCISKNGKENILGTKDVSRGELVDTTFMDAQKLDSFLEEQMGVASANGVLFSIHLKATMMKVSDPVIFGHCVRVFYKDAIAKHEGVLQDLGVDFNNGLGDLWAKIKGKAYEQDIKKDFNNVSRPPLAMVDSDKGITNLHVPSDVIVDASMPAAIRSGGKMWNKDGETQDALFVIPDSTYAPLYDETIKNCIAHGKLDPTTLGSVSNVGLMAFKAEEYGSHPTTFIMNEDAKVIVRTKDSHEIPELTQELRSGDIYRLVCVKDEAIKSWVELAVNRARITKDKTIFWLDENRAHTNKLIQIVQNYLKQYDTQDLDLEILSTKDAAKLSIERARKGLNTISVTGNVLRDYNTDLYPIMELGTSAKMLSIVPLLAGGGLFETGAGGSAPKHVQQLIEENHLRWDSLGEFLALVPSLELIAQNNNNSSAKILAQTLDLATQTLLDEDKSPKRKTGELDNRGSHFYLTLYWAKELSKQSEDKQLQTKFIDIYEQLQKMEEKIVNELQNAQGVQVDIGGYYRLDEQKASEVMRPSETFNEIILKI